MSVVLDEVCRILSQIAPLRLAESWDNVGLLVGDRRRQVGRILTCLTITPNVVDEAIESKADLIVAHHPLPFKALQRITADSIPGGMLLRLIENGIGIYSAHTAFDSAKGGINQMWAERLNLTQIQPLQPIESSSSGSAGDTSEEGAGRLGIADEAHCLGDLARVAAQSVNATAPRLVGDPKQPVKKIAFACGSGGSFLSAAKRRGCDALITGEATFHTCLEAESFGIGLVLLGHYWSERFAMEQMAEQLSAELADVEVWGSRQERDPLISLS